MRQVMLPASLEELWALRKEHPDALVMAGGTDLLVRMRATKKDLRPVLVLERIEELVELGEKAAYEKLPQIKEAMKAYKSED